jgi:hypothetical protein
VARRLAHTKTNSCTLGVRDQGGGFAYKTWQFGSREHLDIVVFSHICTRVTMRSIIVCTVILAIVGLIHAQNRRLITDFNISQYLDLANTGMGTTNANAFINQICKTAGPADVVRGAINIKTNRTMPFDRYRKGPGYWGTEEYNYAKYPWSTFEGRCFSLLNSSWVTDRAIVNGPAVKNMNWRNRTMTVGIDTVYPMVDATTTQSGWGPKMGDATWLANFFVNSRQRPNPLVHTMLWFDTDLTEHHSRLREIPECSQGWLTAAMVARTIIAFSSFTVEHYYWASKPQGKWWESVQGGVSDTWMAVKRDKGEYARAYPTGFTTLYSSAVHVRVETLSKMLPGPHPQEIMTLQFQTTPLPLQDCDVVG